MCQRLQFNAEGMKFNEIKKSETLLKDETKSAWLVGYLKKNLSGEATHVTYTPDDAFQTIVSVTNKEWYDCIAFPGITPSKTYYCVDKTQSYFYWKMQVPGNSWPTYVDTAIRLGWDLNGENRVYGYDHWNGKWKDMSQEALIIRAPW